MSKNLITQLPYYPGFSLISQCSCIGLCRAVKEIIKIAQLREEHIISIMQIGYTKKEAEDFLKSHRNFDYAFAEAMNKKMGSDKKCLR